MMWHDLFRIFHIHFPSNPMIVVIKKNIQIFFYFFYRKILKYSFNYIFNLLIFYIHEDPCYFYKCFIINILLLMFATYHHINITY